MLLLVVFLAPIVWGLVDAVRRPKEAFAAAGQKRGLWIGLLLVALIAPPIIGAAVGVWYLAMVRRKVVAATPIAPPADER